MGLHKAKIRKYDEQGNISHKQCGKCKEVLSVADYYKSGKVSINNIDGYMYQCIPCHKANWHKHGEDPEKRKRWLLERIRSKCKKQNLPFDLTIEDLVIPTHCPIFGIPLKFGVKTPSSYREKKGQVIVPDDSPSVDRIVSELGYVKDNIVIVSYRANLIKTNASVSELIKVADFYRMLTSKQLEASGAYLK